MPGFDTCVGCIVLNGAGPDAPPHPELGAPRLRAEHTAYECSACGTHWAYDPQQGWKSMGASS